MSAKKGAMVPKLTTHGGKSYEEIGKLLGVSKTRVQFLEKQALNKMLGLMKLKYGSELEISDLFPSSEHHNRWYESV